MSSYVSVYVDTHNLDRIIAQIDGKAEEVGKEIGGYCENIMRGYAPVRTGWLRDHIYAEFPGGNVLARVGTHDTPYDIYQEFGTYKMAAHPYVWPAAQDCASKYLSASNWVRLFK